MTYIPTPTPTGENQALEAYLEEELHRIGGEINRMHASLYPAYGGFRLLTPYTVTLPAGTWVILHADQANPAVNVGVDLPTGKLTFYRGGTYLWGLSMAFESASAMIISLTAFIDGVPTGKIQQIEFPVNANFHSFSVSGLGQFVKGSTLQIALQTVAAESIILDNYRLYATRVPSYDIDGEPQARGNIGA